MNTKNLLMAVAMSGAMLGASAAQAHHANGEVAGKMGCGGKGGCGGKNGCGGKKADGDKDKKADKDKKGKKKDKKKGEKPAK